MYVLLYDSGSRLSNAERLTPNPSVNRTPCQLRLPVPSPAELAFREEDVKVSLVVGYLMPLVPRIDVRT
jgi:hypothetical protein